MRTFKEFLKKGEKVSEDQAKEIGDQLGIDWDEVDLEQFRMGLEVETEHGSHDEDTDVTSDDALATGKIAWAHIKEDPEYYTKLKTIEPHHFDEEE